MAFFPVFRMQDTLQSRTLTPDIWINLGRCHAILQKHTYTTHTLVWFPSDVWCALFNPPTHPFLPATALTMLNPVDPGLPFSPLPVHTICNIR